MAAVMNAPIRADASLFTDSALAERPGCDWESFPTGEAELAAEAKEQLTRIREQDRIREQARIREQGR